jgi:hypothetical protein
MATIKEMSEQARNLMSRICEVTAPSRGGWKVPLPSGERYLVIDTAGMLEFSPPFANSADETAAVEWMAGPGARALEQAKAVRAAAARLARLLPILAAAEAKHGRFNRQLERFNAHREWNAAVERQGWWEDAIDAERSRRGVRFRDDSDRNRFEALSASERLEWLNTRSGHPRGTGLHAAPTWSIA